MILPEGWKAMEKGVGSEEPAILGPVMDGYVLHIKFYRGESYYGLLHYVACAQTIYMRNDKSIKEVQEDTLLTDDGTEYIRWEITLIVNEVTYHQTHYFIGEDEEILTIVYFRRENAASEFDSQVDQSIRTVIFTPLS